MKKLSVIALAAVATALFAFTARAQSSYEPFAFSTLAGSAGNTGTADGTGSAARFNSPSGVVLDAAGNAYIADTGNNTIRKVTPAGVVSTYAGSPGVAGSANGSLSAARFNSPIGLAIDAAGNIYVADTGNSTIRKISAGGTVSTLAGSVGTFGYADGTGTAAIFAAPRGVAADSSGNVFVADTFNHVIRKITSAGVVSTFAGLGGSAGITDGTGSAARFNGPKGIAIDSSGNLYVGDTFSSTIRKVTSAAVVTTLAGSPGVTGSADGIGSAARFYAPTSIAVDQNGVIYVADTNNATIRRVRPGGTVTTLGGSPTVTGSTDGSGSVARFNAPQGIAVSPTEQLIVGDTANNTIRFGVSPYGTLANISTRGFVQTGNNVLIGGFILHGTVSKPVLIRTLGPTLGVLGVANSLQDTVVQLFNASNTMIGENDDWQTAPNAGSIPTGQRPPDPRESAILTSLAPGNYTAILSGKNNTIGVGLVEVYDEDATVNAELSNVSTRGFVGTGDNVMIGGFITGGGTAGTQVLIRVLGPTLSLFGIPGVLANPTVSLYNGNGTLLAVDDNWKDSQQSAIQGTGYAPPNDLESAILTTLAAGNYTAIVSGVGGGTGVALVEVYNLR